MSDLIRQIQNIVKNVIKDTINIKYLEAEVTSLNPLTFVSDRYKIIDKQVLFTELATPTQTTLTTYSITPDRVTFTGCKGHEPSSTGVGTSSDFTIEQVTKNYTLWLNRPLQVGDKVYLQKLNKQYLYLGRVGTPYTTQTLPLEEEN